MTRKLGERIPSPAVEGETWTPDEQRSWEVAGSPPAATPEYQTWRTNYDNARTAHQSHLNADAADLNQDSDNSAVAFLEALGYVPGSRPYLAYMSATTKLANAADRKFVEQNGTAKEYIEGQTKESPEVTSEFLKKKYEIARASFRAKIITAWKSGKLNTADLGVPEIDEIVTRNIPAIEHISPSLVTRVGTGPAVQALRKISNITPSDVSNSELAHERRLPVERSRAPSPVIKWWERQYYEPWVVEATNAIEIVIRSDGELTKPFLDSKISRDSIGFVNIEQVFSQQKRAESLEEFPHIGKLNQDNYEQALLSGINEPTDEGPWLDITQTSPAIVSLKKSAVHYLLEYLDKVGYQEIFIVDAPPPDSVLLDSLAQKAIVSSYYSSSDGGEVYFKISIHRKYLDPIPQITHRQQLFEKLFGSYYNDYWEEEIVVKTYGKKMRAFKETMYGLEEDLKAWVSEGNFVEPANFSFIQDYKDYETLIKASAGGLNMGALGYGMLRTNWKVVKKKKAGSLPGWLDDGDTRTEVENGLSWKALSADPNGKLVVVYDDQYVVQGVYAVSTDPAISGPLAPNKKTPLRVAFKKYKNSPAFSSKNISYLANMQNIIDDYKAKKGLTHIIKEYITPAPTLTKILGTSEAPGIKSFDELQKENRMLEDPLVRSKIYERNRKSKVRYAGDPTFTVIERTSQRITSIASAYTEFLNLYGLPWIGKQVLECLMTMIGLGQCEPRLQAILTGLGVEKYRKQILVPYAEWLGESANIQLDSMQNNFAGSLDALEDDSRLAKEAYYQNLYVLDSGFYTAADEASDRPLTEQQRQTLLDANKELVETINANEENKRNIQAWSGTAVNTADFFNQLSKQFDLKELCETLRDILDALWDGMFGLDADIADFRYPPKPTINLPESFFTLSLFKTIGTVVENALLGIIEQLAAEAVKNILKLLQKICGDMQFALQVGYPFQSRFEPSTPATLPLSADDLRDLLNDLFGDDKNPSSLMGGLNDLLDSLSNNNAPETPDIGLILKNILDQLSEDISAPELCQLIEGNASQELLQRVKTLFDTVDLLKRVFPDTGTIAAFFEASGGLINTGFCNALLSIEQSDIEDLCDLPPGSLADASRLGEKTAEGYRSLQDQLEKILEELVNQIASDGNNDDLMLPLLDDCTPPVQHVGGPPHKPPVVKWKEVPVVANANNVAIETFFHDVGSRYQNTVPRMKKALVQSKAQISFNPDDPENMWTSLSQRTYTFTKEDDDRVGEKVREFTVQVQQMASALAEGWTRVRLDPAHNDDSWAAEQAGTIPTEFQINHMRHTALARFFLAADIQKWLVSQRIKTISEGASYVRLGTLERPTNNTIENGGLKTLMFTMSWNASMTALASLPGELAKPAGLWESVFGDGLKYTIDDVTSIFIGLEPTAPASTISYPTNINYSENEGSFVPLEGQTIEYVVRVPRAEDLQPIGKFYHTVLRNPSELYQTPPIAYSDDSLLSARFVNVEQNYENTLELRYPGKEFVNGLPSKMKDEFRPNKNIFNPSVGGLQIATRPSIQIDDLVDDPNDFDAFTLRYNNSVEIEQHRLPIKGDSPDIREPVSMGSLEGSENYEIVFNDYKKNPNLPGYGGSKNKVSYFINFLAKSINTIIPPLDAEAPPELSSVSPEHLTNLYTAPINGFFNNIFMSMIHDNPFFDNPGELPNVEIIPSSNQRIQRSRGFVPISLPISEEPDAPTNRTFIKIGSPEALKIIEKLPDMRPEIGPLAPRGDLLSLDSLKQKVKKDFLASPLCEDPSDPFANKNLSQLEAAALAGVVYLILRAYTLEFLFKILPTTPMFNIQDIFKSNVVPIYIVQNLKMDMSQNSNYYCEFQKGVDKVIGDMSKRGATFTDPLNLDPETGDPVELALGSASTTFEEKLVYLLKNQIPELQKEYDYILEQHVSNLSVASSGIPPAAWASLKKRKVSDTIQAPSAPEEINNSPPSNHYDSQAFPEIFTRDIGSSRGQFYYEKYVRVVDLPYLNDYTGPNASHSINDDQGRPRAPVADALLNRRGGAQSQRFPPRADPGYLEYIRRPDLHGVVNYDSWLDYMDQHNGIFSGRRTGEYFEKLAYGVRLMYVAKTPADKSALKELFGDVFPTVATGLGGNEQASIEEKAFAITEVAGAAEFSEQYYTIPLMSVEEEIDPDFVWGTEGISNLEDYRINRLEPEKREVWAWGKTELNSTPEYQFLMEYIYPMERIFGTAFLFTDSYVSSKYFETDRAFTGLKASLRMLYLLMIDDNPFGVKSGRCNDDWGLQFTGMSWDEMLEELGFDWKNIIFDTLSAAVLAVLQIAGAAIDPFGLLKLILCPLIKTDGTFGGMANNIKKAWDCPEFPDMPPWPEFDDNPCDPSTEAGDICELDIPISDYFTVQASTEQEDE